MNLPQSLRDKLARREAVLVAGPNCATPAGSPSWSDLCESLCQVVKHADRAAHARRLLAAGRTGAAMSLLRSWLDPEVLSTTLRDTVADAAETPAALTALCGVGFRGIVTTTIDDRWTQATAAAGDPASHSFTGAQGGAFAACTGRFLLHVFGRAADPPSLCLSPWDVRERLAPAGLTAALGDLWARCAFVFVGFAADDPGLALLLGSVLGARPGALALVVLPEAEADAADELHAGFGLTPLPFAGDVAGAVLAFAHAASDIETSVRPAADDVAGWLALLACPATADEATGVVDRMVADMESGQRWDDLAALLVERAPYLPLPSDQVATLQHLARVLEEKLASPERAFTVLCAALAHGPVDAGVLEDLDRTAKKAGPDALAELDRRLGDVQVDAAVTEVARRICDVHRRAQRWEALAALLQTRIAAATSPADARPLRRELAEIYAAHLSRTPEAVALWEAALAEDPSDDVALNAVLELHQRAGRDAEAARVLERLAAATADGPARHAALLRAARLHEQRGDLATAAALLEKVGGGDSSGADSTVLRESDRAAATLALARIRQAQGDRVGARAALLAAAETSLPAAERARCLAEAAALQDEVPAGQDEALRLFSRAFALDPRGAPGAERLADLLEGHRRWDDLQPVLEALAARTPGNDRAALAALACRLGVCVLNLADHVRARACFERARVLDPDLRPAAFALAAIHMDGREWVDAITCWDSLLRQEGALTATERLRIRLGLAEATLALGTRVAALEHYTQALAIDSANLVALHGLAAVHAERGEHEPALDAKRKLLPLVSSAQRAALWEDIGDLQRGTGGSGAALDSYEEALRLEPDRRRTLHKRLDLEATLEMWPAALATLERLVVIEDDAAVRSRYQFSAALIHRDHDGDLDKAVTLLEQAHDSAPDDDRAFTTLERLLSDRDEWRLLRRLYRKRLRAIDPGTNPALEAHLWSALGELSVERFSDRDTAMLALEAAARLEPASIDRHTRLATLYLDMGPSAADKAIAEHQTILALDAGRASSYQALFELYGQVGEAGRRFWPAAALVHLGSASPQLARAVADHRPPQLVPADAGLTDTLWDALAHELPTPHGPLDAVLAISGSLLVSAVAQRRTALGLRRQDRIVQATAASEPGSRSRAGQPPTGEVPWFPAEALAYLTRVLNVEAPELHFRPDHFCPLSTHPMIEDDRVLVALVAGPGLEARLSDDGVAFELARRAACLRPRHLAAVAFANGEALAGAVAALRVALGLEATASDDATRLLARDLGRLLDRRGREAVAELSHLLAECDPTTLPAASEAWLAGCDATALRAAFLLTGDLGAAEAALALDASLTGRTDHHARVMTLAAYSVGEAHCSLRAALALDATDEQGGRRWAAG